MLQCGPLSCASSGNVAYLNRVSGASACGVTAAKYRIRCNFREVKISHFLWISRQPRKFYPTKFIMFSYDVTNCKLATLAR